MLRMRYVGIIARKELIDSLRDWRTLLVMIGLPIVLYPLMMIGSSQVIISQAEKIQKTPSKVAIIGAHEGAEVVARLRNAPGIAIVETAEWLVSGEGASLPNVDVASPDVLTDAQATDIENISAALRHGRIHAVLSIEKGFDRQLASDRAGHLKLYVDNASDLSDSAGKKVRSLIQALGDEIALDRLERLGHSKELIEPLGVEVQNLASAERMGGSMAGRFLPYILILMILMGAMYPAMDLTAGEKERKTMETLLVSPASRLELVTGKYVAIFFIAIGCALLNLASLAFSIARVLPSDLSGTGAPSANLGISFAMSPWTVLGFFVFMVPVAGLFAGLSMAVCSFARTYKEAQLYITPLVLLTIMPAMVSMLPGVELTYGLSLVPIANVTLLFREVLAQETLSTAKVAMALLVFLSTAFYAYLSLRLAAWIFEGENILLPSPEGPRFSLQQLWRRRSATAFSARIPQATIEQAVILVLFSFVLQYYLAPVFLKSGVRTALLLSETALILLPTLLLAWLTQIRASSGLGLARARGSALLLAAIGGVVAFVGATSLFVLQSQFWPAPQGQFERLQQTMTASSIPELGLVLCLGAVLPAVCEEMLFRGVFLHAWRARVGVSTAAIISAVVFGLFHLDMYRLAPVTLVGLVAAAVCVRTRSILPAIVVHFINNSCAVVLSFLGSKGVVPTWYSVPLATAALALAAAIVLLWRLLLQMTPVGESADAVHKS
ncbi:MAG: ABC transporter permease subunit/CPBP intramembrane protease [Planctomycetota bacterium]|nr:ABC transporter permease subunit/CPBP intramembrane protease [Planctomycetota bacterium]